MAFVANVHVPRLISAMFPAGKPAKSAGEQPRLSETVLTGAVTSPLPEYCMMLLTSGPAGGGATCSRTAGVSEMNVWNWNSCTVTWYPAASSRSFT